MTAESTTDRPATTENPSDLRAKLERAKIGAPWVHEPVGEDGSRDIITEARPAPSSARTILLQAYGNTLSRPRLALIVAAVNALPELLTRLDAAEGRAAVLEGALRMCVDRFQRPEMSPDANVVLERALRALASPSTAGTGWLPIADAPRDGTVVDLWSAENNERIADAWWSGTDKLRKNEEHRWHAPNQDYDGESGWIGNGRQITHFRPLPPAPTTEEK